MKGKELYSIFGWLRSNRFFPDARSGLYEKGGPAKAPIKRPQKTIVIGWELGGGAGHLNRLLPIAKELSATGYRLICAFRNVMDGSTTFATIPNLEIIQAPAWHRDRTKPKATGFAYNYADLLFECGYFSEEILAEYVAGWRLILDLYDPALIVCDHSPTLVLAAAGRCPVVILGSGFSTPPSSGPFLPLHPESSKGAVEREAVVLQSIRAIQTELRVPLAKTVPDLFGYAESYTCSVPELDPYRSARPSPSLGPMKKLPKMSTFPDSKESLVFGYLNGLNRRVPELLESLSRYRIRCAIYLRSSGHDLAARFGGTTLSFFENPQDLPEVLSTSSAIIHHGGLSTTEIALAVGRPQFLLSGHLEQALTSDSMQGLGCGLHLNRRSGELGRLIKKALNDGNYRSSATNMARKLGERAYVGSKLEIVNRCLKHLR